MKAIVSTWKYLIIISNTFILGMVHQSTTYELKESAYCEWYCTKVQQQWDGSCHVYGSCRWYCQVKRKDCIPGTRYHCARDLHNKDLFIETCAPEIFCLAGEEPQISLQQSGKASVHCKPCYRRNMFNGRHNTSSAVFSECSTFKTNFSPDPAVASVYTTVTTVVEDKATHLFIEKPPNESRPNKRIFEVVVTGASLFIAVFIVLVFVKQKKDRRRKRQEIQSPIELRPFLTPENFNRGSEVIIEGSESQITNDTDGKATANRENTCPANATASQMGPFLTPKNPNRWSAVIIEGSESQITNDTDGKATANRENTCPANATASPAIPMDRDSGASFTATAVTEPSDNPGVGPMEDKEESTSIAIETPENKNTSEEIPLQTIEPNEEKPEILALNSTISSPEKLKIVTDHFGKGVGPMEDKVESKPIAIATPKNKNTSAACILENKPAICYALRTKATTHDTKAPQDRQVSADPTVRTKVKSQAAISDCIEPRVLRFCKARTDTTATYKRSSKSQTRNYTTEDRCKEAYASLKNNEVFTFDEGSLYDNLKEKCILELTDCDTIHSIYIAGFKTYGIPGVETGDLYQLISYLLCGNENLKGTLQLAAALYGIHHFNKYLKALLKEFNQSKTPLIEARIFFELHGIYFNGFTLNEDSVSIALDNLFHQLAVTGSTGPFHATLLGGVLHCNLFQHFENNDYHDRDVRTTAGFKVALKSSSSRTRELHIVWMKSANYPHRYCVVPAFKIDDTNMAKQTHITQIQNEGMVKTLIENIKEQEPYKWRSCFEVLEQSQTAMFDDLNGMEFIKPDRIIRTINVPGFKAYTKPREENTSMYEWLSLMLCGDNSLMYILRLAAARYAMKQFETYVDKLNKEFNGDENPFYAAKVFFKLHEIDFEEKETNVRGSLSVAFRKLVNETVNADKGNAPYYVEFLSGVLNRKIIQHFEDNKFYGRVVESIRGLDVSLTTELSSDRDLHMYWMKSSNYNGQHTYQIVPLYRCNPKSNGKDLCEDVYELLMRQAKFEPDSCLEMIDAHGIDVFEELKGYAILKPTTDAKRVINTYDWETMCLYEHTSRLLFGITEKKFILRLAAIRYALQNCSTYVKQHSIERSGRGNGDEGRLHRDPPVRSVVGY